MKKRRLCENCDSPIGYFWFFMGRRYCNKCMKIMFDEEMGKIDDVHDKK